MGQGKPCFAAPAPDFGAMATEKRTPLYEEHKALGGRMVPFAGWQMPVQYSSIMDEHNCVRNKAGLFDVSHMGEILVTGQDAADFLDRLSCNEVASMQPGQVRYNAILNQAGGLVDDVTVYCISPEEFFICSNASNYETVHAHLQKHSDGFSVNISNESKSWHQLAIQGPKAESILAALLGEDLSGLAYYHFRDTNWQGSFCRISRTGYTGEDGFEIYSDVKTGISLWKELLSTGASEGLQPIGLGARDTLRLEARYPLYGHELNTGWTPVESGIGFIVKKKAKPYFGSERILQHKEEGPSHRVCGFVLDERGVPREGLVVTDENGTPIGKVLSGSFSPTLKQGIGTSYLPVALTKPDTKIRVVIRNKAVPAHIHKGPFVRGGAGRS